MTASPSLLLRVYAAAIFLSAALLFAVQPMFTKMVLPKLGGTPAVWSVAMVFFQAVLLTGYAYAHALTRLLPLRVAIAVQLAVTGAAVRRLGRVRGRIDTGVALAVAGRHPGKS